MNPRASQLEPTSSSDLKPYVTLESLYSLESEIVDLWGHITAATYRFLELVAEFDRNEGWGRQGPSSYAKRTRPRPGIASAMCAFATMRTARCS